MTSTPARGAEPDRGAQQRPLRALSATPALIILLLVGLGLRLAIAAFFFPHSGFITDLSSYTSWAETLYRYGPGGFYANAGFADYPPGYLYLLWPIGYLAHIHIAGVPVDLHAEDIVKIGPILLDVAVGYVLYRLVRGWSGGGSRGHRLGMIAAALYLFNPVTWYDSALWGQTDAAGALVMLLCVGALVRGNSEGASALAVVAAMVKPQFGIVMIPLVAVVLLRRHLNDRLRDDVRERLGEIEPPRHPSLIPGRIGEWLLEHQGPVRIATSFAVAWIVFFTMALPFGMGPVEYLVFLARTAGGYPYVTVNAYNPWVLIGAGGQTSLAASHGAYWIKDTLPFIGPVTPLMVGTLCLALGFLATIAAVFYRPDRTRILIGAVVLSAAFFILPTRVHERYLFPVFAFLPILAVWSGKWRWITLAFAVGSFMNLHAILTNDNPVYGTANVAHLAFGDLFRTFPFVALSALLQTAAFAVAVWQLRPSAVNEELEAYEFADGRGRRRRTRQKSASLPGRGGRIRGAACQDRRSPALRSPPAARTRPRGSSPLESAGPGVRASPRGSTRASGR